jgi:hypothetical protein
MQVRLLGPVDVVVDGEPRPVPGLRRKAVLATLALQSGEIVSVSQLVETVWGDSGARSCPLSARLFSLSACWPRLAARPLRGPSRTLAVGAGTPLKRR